MFGWYKPSPLAGAVWHLFEPTGKGEQVASLCDRYTMTPLDDKAFRLLQVAEGELCQRCLGRQNPRPAA